MSDSLVIAGVISLLGRQASTLPQCPGAVFTLAPGFNLGAPQPQADPVTEMIIDGSRPVGRRSGNRVISLDIIITGPSRQIITAARELLLQLIDQPQWQFTWTRDGGLPLVLDCYRAQAAQIGYNLTRDAQLLSMLTVTFEAKPFGRSDTPVTVQFASPASTASPPPSPVLLDAYTSSGGWATGWSRSTQHAIGPYSAHWDIDIGGAGNYPSLTRSFSAVNITGLSALSWRVGLGGDRTWTGNVTFSWVLSDGTHTLTVGTTTRCTSSDAEDAPFWQQVAAPLPAAGTFNLANVTGYTFTAWTSTGHITADDVYLDCLQAVPTSSAAVPTSRGTVYTLPAVQGSARAPMSMLVQLPPVTDPVTTTFNTAGPITWTPPAGVTSVLVKKWGAGGRGSRRTTSGYGGGGKGGEYAANPTFAVTPGVPISGYVGRAGATSGGTADLIQQVATGTLNSQSGTSFTAQVSATMAAGHTLLVAVGYGNNGGSVAGITDTQSNTYTLVEAADTGSTSGRGAELWRCNPSVPLGPTDHLTITLSAAQDHGAAAWAGEFNLLGTVDMTPAYHYQPSGGTSNAVAGTMTASDAVAVAVNVVNAGTVNPYADSPYTSAGSDVSSSAGGLGLDLRVVRRTSPGAGSSTATFHWDNSHSAVAVIAGFPAGAVSGNINGEDTWFGVYDSACAHGGLGVADDTATGATAMTGTSTDTNHYAGGNGATGTASGGGGGGESAGSGGTGGAGAVTAGGSGRGDAGDGGTGGASGGNNAGGAGAQPGGGGGGGFSTGGAAAGGSGGDGKITLTYIPPLSAFRAYIAHRPGEDSPALLSPIIPVGNGLDTPNGATEYVIPQPVDGQNARFGGTYTVVLAASNVNTPANSRNIKVIFTQYEYAGGPSATATVGGSGGVDITPTGNVSNNLFILGEITLPVRDLPDDNVASYLTVKVDDSNESDRFMDLVLLDVTGQTAAVGVISGATLDSGSGYPSFWLDEPDVSTDLGLCLASTYGRGQAVSVIDSAVLTGGPLTLDPGDNALLLYSPSGQPAITATYYPRWMADRPQ